MCIGVTDVFPTALIRQFIFLHSTFFSPSSGALVDVGAFPQLIVLQIHWRLNWDVAGGGQPDGAGETKPKPW